MTGDLGSFRIRNKLSRDYRRFSTLLVDEHIIIDPSEDIFEFEETFLFLGMVRGITDAVITHSHLDHFSISAIERLAKECGHLRVYASEVMKDEIEGIANVEFVPIYLFSILRIGKYNILPLPTNHKTDIPGEDAFNFLIECDGKTVFYAIDGAFINPDAWHVLKELRLDVAILDCGAGIAPYTSATVNHNNLSMAIAVRDVFLSAAVADEGTKFILSHIPTVKRGSTHEELAATIGDLPIKIAYDGYYIGI